MRTRMVGVFLVLCVVAWASLRSGHGQKQDGKKDAPADQKASEVAVFMHAKLDHCQKLLEGLTRENYDLIRVHAQELSLLSQAAQWQVIQTPQYLERSVEFRRAADALKEAGRNRNLDGAALAYVDMTMKCIECHKYVRRTRMAQLELPGNPFPTGGE